MADFHRDKSDLAASGSPQLAGLAGFHPGLHRWNVLFGKAGGDFGLPSVRAVAVPKASKSTLGWALIALQQLSWIPTALVAGVAAVVIGINLVLRHSDRDDEDAIQE